MNILAAELRAAGAALRNRRERAVAAFTAWRLRTWAEAVERGDVTAIEAAALRCEQAIEVARRPRCGHDFEVESYETARRVLRRALEATRAA